MSCSVPKRRPSFWIPFRVGREKTFRTRTAARRPAQVTFYDLSFCSLSGKVTGSGSWLCRQNLLSLGKVNGSHRASLAAPLPPNLRGPQDPRPGPPTARGPRRHGRRSTAHLTTLGCSKVSRCLSTATSRMVESGMPSSPVCTRTRFSATKRPPFFRSRALNTFP